MIFGKPKSGKTFVTADMFMHVPMGRDYCGCAVQQGAVVYITKEGVRGFQSRMLAMREHYNIGPEVPFYVAHEMPNFGTNNGDAEALVELIHKLVPRGVRIAAIIIDTLARTMPGQSDSDPAVMSQFVENCNVVASAFGCFVGAVQYHRTPAATTPAAGVPAISSMPPPDSIISGDQGRCQPCLDRQDRGPEGRRRGAELAVSNYQKAKPKRRFRPPLRNLVGTAPERRKRNQSETKYDRRGAPLLRHPLRGNSRSWRDRARVGDRSPPTSRSMTRNYFKKLLGAKRGFGSMVISQTACAPWPANTSTRLCRKRKLIGADAVYVWLPKP